MLQLTLGIELRDDATFANFYEGENTQVIASIKQMIVENGEQFIYLYGVEGSGRSHLLQSACQYASENDFPSAYLPMHEIQNLSPEILANQENTHLVCIDDIDAVLGKKDWEEALFHLYNCIREKKSRLIVSGNNPPNLLSCRLPDLQSRLSWGLTYPVKELNDEQMLLALQMRAHRRGIELSTDVAQFLLRRYPRNMGALFDVLMELDRASLSAKRRLTIPFVKQILQR